MASAGAHRLHVEPEDSPNNLGGTFCGHDSRTAATIVTEAPTGHGIVDFTPDPTLYPFESNWFDSSVGPVHYIDEGTGRPIFLMHGNPAWSFLYRKIIPLLSKHFRCIAPDLPGFGLSAHPDDYSYMPDAQARIMAELVDHLDLRDMVVMGEDWGGPISIDMASRRPERVTGLVYGNTWFWPTDNRNSLILSRVLATRPMQWLIREKNVLATRGVKQMLEAPTTDAELAHYADVFPTPESRRGPEVFPVAIRTAEPWLRQLEVRVKTELADRPLLLIFGRKDPLLGGKKMSDRWMETFPNATLVELQDAGHFFQSDAPKETADAIISKFATG